jgi:N-acetylmuramoyl-L-alanine amidase
MLSLLLKYAKKALTILLIGFLLTTGHAIAEQREYIKCTVIERTVETMNSRACDVIIRVGEYQGKAGKRIYIDNGISWKLIPTDIPIHQDNEGHYISEFDINKKVAEKLVKELQANGVNAKIQVATRKSEDLNNAARIANYDNPKLYISLHHNYYNSDSTGYFAMCNENDETALNIANRLSDSIHNCLIPQRYTRQQDGYIGELNNLNNTTVGVLMELGFFSNLDELKTICSDEYTDFVSSNMATEIQSILNDWSRLYVK